MNKMFKFMSQALCVAVIATGATSCSDSKNNDEPEDNSKNELLQAALTPYVQNTVIPTYKGMADNAILMSEACNAMQEAFEKGTLTSEMVAEAGKYWNLSRAYWEKSEAFLFDAAGDYNVDPHIDSWPLDKTAMDALLVDLRAGKEWNIDNNAGYGLLGYHAVEYMLFELSEDGNTSLTHNTNYTKEELIYLTTVAEDLRNQCVLLESAWAGFDNITKEKQQMLEDADLVKDFDYGYSMMNPGKGGSKYKTVQAAAEAIIQGCIDIADEVGLQKIGRPVNGSSDEDKNYIESPYSLNSIVDFYDNIESIKNAYTGSVSGDASVSDYIKKVNPTLDTKVRNQIDAAQAAIKAIPEPFAKSSKSESALCQKAVTEVGTNLVNVLEEVMTELSKN